MRRAQMQFRTSDITLSRSATLALVLDGHAHGGRVEVVRVKLAKRGESDDSSAYMVLRDLRRGHCAHRGLLQELAHYLLQLLRRYRAAACDSATRPKRGRVSCRSAGARLRRWLATVPKRRGINIIRKVH